MMKHFAPLLLPCFIWKLVSSLSLDRTRPLRGDSPYAASNVRVSNTADEASTTRRGFLAAVTASATLLGSAQSAHAIRAVGGAELDCRAAGNCLEIGEWDGAVGWTWGAKDRCDATDPSCGAGGKQLTLDENGNLRGQPVPAVTADRITHIAALKIDIGRDESSVLRLGLYGKDSPASVQQLLAFLSNEGFEIKALSGNALGELTAPVSFDRGGVATWVTPGASIEFGVPSQAFAYARSRGSSKVLDSFVPQPRPSASMVKEDSISVSHTAAGLVSVPKQGLGYGGTGYESDDTCFERAFLITDAAAPDLDKTRRVIGQVLDGQSMVFLERLTNLPTKRGIRGVLPGQSDGPPLPKVAVREIQVATVVNQPPSSSETL